VFGEPFLAENLIPFGIDTVIPFGIFLTSAHSAEEMEMTAATYAEAKAIADSLRATFKGCDWVVTIHAPLFNGDLYRVVVA
tara:strand:+ start:1271 stop:1513 length:243 start_codon:yes stop_codon:yes gene_type:complete